MQSQIPLLDGGEGDRILKVGDSLEVRGALVALLLLEGVPV